MGAVERIARRSGAAATANAGAKKLQTMTETSHEPCTAADRCKIVTAGGECVSCGGKQKGTGIAGAASYRPALTDIDTCGRCGAAITWTTGKRWLEEIDGCLYVRRGCVDEAACAERRELAGAGEIENA